MPWQGAVPDHAYLNTASNEEDLSLYEMIVTIGLLFNRAGQVLILRHSNNACHTDRYASHRPDRLDAPYIDCLFSAADDVLTQNICSSRLFKQETKDTMGYQPCQLINERCLLFTPLTRLTPKPRAHNTGVIIISCDVDSKTDFDPPNLDTDIWQDDEKKWYSFDELADVEEKVGCFEFSFRDLILAAMEKYQSITNDNDNHEDEQMITDGDEEEDEDELQVVQRVTSHSASRGLWYKLLLESGEQAWYTAESCHQTCPDAVAQYKEQLSGKRRTAWETRERVARLIR